jgi:putative spermidine/putrescine transport system substrate-binding protein
LKKPTIAVLALLLVACRMGDTTTTGDPTASTAVATTSIGEATPVDGMATLVAAAQAEGTLNTVALPRDYCNYGGVIEGFKAKYGMTVNELAPDAGPAGGLEALRTGQGSDTQAPDVIDVDFSLGPTAKDEGLLHPYKVGTWDSIPDHAKDADGYWYGDYYGVLAFEVNSDVVQVVPSDWSDLLDPQYRGQIALAGDPRVSNQAILSIYAASLTTGGSLDDAQPGLDFFAQLNQVGNLFPAIADSTTVASGETPIAIRWTYNALPNRDANAATVPIDVVVPETGRMAGVYVQAISAFAPHPNAARLWMEYLYSDEGQLGWFEGYCDPIRYDDLIARDVIPQDLSAKVPDSTGAVFPEIGQISAAKELITANWDSIVGVEVGG